MESYSASELSTLTQPTLTYSPEEWVDFYRFIKLNDLDKISPVFTFFADTLKEISTAETLQAQHELMQQIIEQRNALLLAIPPQVRQKYEILLNDLATSNPQFLRILNEEIVEKETISESRISEDRENTASNLLNRTSMNKKSVRQIINEIHSTTNKELLLNRYYVNLSNQQTPFTNQIKPEDERIDSFQEVKTRILDLLQSKMSENEITRTNYLLQVFYNQVIRLPIAVAVPEIKSLSASIMKFVEQRDDVSRDYKIYLHNYVIFTNTILRDLLIQHPKQIPDQEETIISLTKDLLSYYASLALLDDEIDHNYVKIYQTISKYQRELSFLLTRTNLQAFPTHTISELNNMLYMNAKELYQDVPDVDTIKDKPEEEIEHYEQGLLLSLTLLLKSYAIYSETQILPQSYQFSGNEGDSDSEKDESSITVSSLLQDIIQIYLDLSILATRKKLADRLDLLDKSLNYISSGVQSLSPSNPIAIKIAYEIINLALAFPSAETSEDRINQRNILRLLKVLKAKGFSNDLLPSTISDYEQRTLKRKSLFTQPATAKKGKSEFIEQQSEQPQDDTKDKKPKL